MNIKLNLNFNSEQISQLCESNRCLHSSKRGGRVIVSATYEYVAQAGAMSLDDMTLD